MRDWIHKKSMKGFRQEIRTKTGKRDMPPSNPRLKGKFARIQKENPEQAGGGQKVGYTM